MSEFTQIELGLVISAKNLAEGTLNTLRSTLESLSGIANKTFQNMAVFENKAQASMQPLANEMKNVASEMNAVGRAASQMGAKTVTAGNEAEASGKKMHSFFQSAEYMLVGQQLETWGHQLLGFFGSAVHSAADFDQNMHNVIASLDAMGDHTMKPQQAFDVLKQKALNLGMSGFFSANEIADAMNVMAQQGITSSQILNGAIETTSRVAAANQQDLKHTANVISDVLHQYGDELGKEFGGDLKHQMEGIGDAMTKSLHNGRMSMEDFLSVMRYAGPEAAHLGVSFKDLSGVIAELARHGIKGSQAGTTLRTMLTSLVPTTNAAKAEFDKLGFTVNGTGNVFYDATGHMKSMTEVQQILHDRLGKLSPAMEQLALKTIFGKYALSGMTAIVNEAPKSFSDLEKSMGQTGTTTEALDEKSKGLRMEIKQLTAHFDTFKKEIGDALEPMVTKLIHTINNLFKAWQSIPKPIKDAMITFGAVGGTIATIGGGFMMFLGTLNMFKNAIVPVLAGIGEGFTGLLGPWGFVIGAVITGVVLIVKHWDQIAKWVKENFGISLPTNLKQWGKVFSDVWGSIKQIGMQVWSQVGPYIIYGVGQIQKIWKQTWPEIQKIFKEVWDKVSTTLQNAWKYIGPTIISGIKEVQKYWNEIWPELQKVFQEVWKGIHGVLLPAVGVLKIVIAGAIGWIKGAWESGWKVIGAALKLVWDLIVNIVKMGWHSISGQFKVGLDLLTGNWGKAWKDLKQTFSNIWNDIKGLFGNLLSDALQFGKNFVQMIANGITGSIGSVIHAASSVASEIKHYLGFASPTKMGPAQTSDLWSPAFVRMFANGLHDTRYLVENEAYNMALVMQKHLDPSNSTHPISTIIQKMSQQVLNVSRAIGGVDPYLQPESDSAYDRRPGHTSHHPTVSDYIWQPGHTSYHPTQSLYDRMPGHVSIHNHINIEGRSAQTDQQLAKIVSDQIGRRFRTHLTVATPY